MTIFLASLAGVPPLGGWFAKFSVFTSLASADTGWGYGLAVIAAINAVIAFGYYGRIALKMWVEEPHHSHTSTIKVPASLSTALAITVATTLAFGIVPGIVTHFTDVSLISLAM
jgi:NADH-quinone oxidoreductase subunit N